MGIVQELRKKNENLEAKNRMLKRMYESQRSVAAEAKMAQAGAELTLKAVVVMNNGKILVTRDALDLAKEYMMVGRFRTDEAVGSEYVLEYLIPEMLGDEEETE